MISGRTPHEDDPRSILRSVLNEEPPRLGALVQGLPEAVDELVRDAREGPGQRTASAGFVVRQIDEILSGSGAAGIEVQRGLLGVVAVILVAAGGLALLGGEDSRSPSPPCPEPVRTSPPVAETTRPSRPSPRIRSTRRSSRRRPRTRRLPTPLRGRTRASA